MAEREPSPKKVILNKINAFHRHLTETLPNQENAPELAYQYAFLQQTAAELGLGYDDNGVDEEERQRWQTAIQETENGNLETIKEEILQESQSYKDAKCLQIAASLENLADLL